MVMNEVQMSESLGANKGDLGKESTGICSLHQAPIVPGLCMQSRRELLNGIVTGGNKRRALRTQGKGPREEGRLGAGGPRVSGFSILLSSLPCSNCLLGLPSLPRLGLVPNSLQERGGQNLLGTQQTSPQRKKGKKTSFLTELVLNQSLMPITGNLLKVCKDREKSPCYVSSYHPSGDSTICHAEFLPDSPGFGGGHLCLLIAFIPRKGNISSFYDKSWFCNLEPKLGSDPPTETRRWGDVFFPDDCISKKRIQGP